MQRCKKELALQSNYAERELSLKGAVTARLLYV